MASKPLPQEPPLPRFPFTFTLRSRVAYWLASSLVRSVYILCFYLIWRFVFFLLLTPQGLLQTLGWVNTLNPWALFTSYYWLPSLVTIITGVLPAFITLTTNKTWQVRVPNLKLLFFSLSVSAVLLLENGLTPLHLGLDAVAIWLTSLFAFGVFGLIKICIKQGSLGRALLLIVITGIAQGLIWSGLVGIIASLLIMMFAIAWLSKNNLLHSARATGSYWRPLIQALFARFNRQNLRAGFSPKRLRNLLHKLKQAANNLLDPQGALEKKMGFGLAIVGWVLLAFITGLVYPVFIQYPGSWLLPSALFAGLVLVALPGLSDVEKLMSWQRAHWRSLVSVLRHNWIRTLTSPSFIPADWFGRLQQNLLKWWKRYWVWLGLLAVIAWGGIVVPLGVNFFTPVMNLGEVLTLMTVGVGSSLLFAVFYIIGWFILSRPRYIVFPFVVANATDPEASELRAYASALTQHFVTQLQTVQLLLNYRQVENVYERTDNPLGLFVTIGREDLQLPSLVIQSESVKFDLAGVLQLVTHWLAQVRVQGTVQLRADRSLEFRVEVQQAQRQATTFSTTLTAAQYPAQLGHISAAALSQAARELALKLVLRLEATAPITTSWESLKSFVEGLEAGAQQNWWSAVVRYRRAIHLEEAQHGHFAKGHYHLGAALLLRGSLDKGRRHLEIAEMTGPVLPEAQYMMALSLLNEKWGEINNRQVFDEIVHHAERALQWQPQLPEAHHLLGVAYYQLGKLLKQATTLPPSPVNRDFDQPFSYYHRLAIQHFHQALRLYDQTLRRLPQDALAQQTWQDEHARLFNERMETTHLLGDALRELGWFAEADSFYQDMAVALPGNVRNLIDQAKIYCLAGNWENAVDFMNREVLSHAEGRWRADVNFYYGWAWVGGLADEQRFWQNWLEKWLFKLVLPPVLQADPPQRRLELVQERLLKAFQHLDYALYEYPKYGHEKQPNNWLALFEQLLLLLAPAENSRATAALGENFWQLRFWLQARLAQYQHPQHPTPIAAALPPEAQTLRQLRAEFEALLRESKRLEVFADLEHNGLERLKIGEKAYTHWQALQQSFAAPWRTPLPATAPLTLDERLQVDLYAEYGLFTARLLAEGQAYEWAAYVAHTTLETLDKWRENRWACWKSYLHQQPQVGGYAKALVKRDFSRKVFACQRATLFAWQAFALWHCKQNLKVQERWQHTPPNNFEFHADWLNLDTLEGLVREALNLMETNPLALFVNAQLLHLRGRPHQAVDMLQRVLRLMAPFSPRRRGTTPEMWSSSQRADAPQPVEGLEKVAKLEARRLKDEPEALPDPLFEWASGRWHFNVVLHEAQLYLALAAVFENMWDLKLSVSYTFEALIRAPHEDVYAHGLILLTRRLCRLARFNEAYSVIKEALTRSMHLAPVWATVAPFAPTPPNAATACQMPHVLRCQLYAWRGHHQRALLLAGKLHERTTLPSFQAAHRTLVKDLKFDAVLQPCVEAYEQRLAAVTTVKGLVEMLGQFSQQYGILLAAVSAAAVPAGLPGLALGLHQRLMILAQDMRLWLEHYCEIHNVLAYSRAQLNLELEDALKDAREAVGIMEALNGLKATQPSVDYAEHLTRYYDTCAWVKFRMSYQDRAELVPVAQHELESKALPLKQEEPIVDFHLARVHLRALEQIWQGCADQAALRRQAEEINQHFSAARRHWQNAHRLDKNGRLEAELKLLQARLNRYLENWDKVQMHLFAPKT